MSIARPPEDARHRSALRGGYLMAIARPPEDPHVFDSLADFVDRHVAPGVLVSLVRS